MTPSTPPDPGLEAIRFPVAGMVCGTCAGRITRAVTRLDGVSGVHVDLEGETVTVRRERASVSDAALVAAVAAAGYEADLASAVPVALDRAARGPLARLLGRLR